MSRLARIAASLVLATMVSGCAAASLLTGGGPAPATYDLTAPVSFEGLGSTSRQLAVTEPTAIGALNSERIVIRPAPAVVTYLGESRWNDRLPLLVQARLIEAFQNSGKLAAVAPPGGAQVSDFGLVTDLRAFEIKAYEGQAVIDLSARLIAGSNGRVVASKHFRVAVPIEGVEAGPVIAGLNAAFDQLSREIVAWTLGVI